MTKIIIRKILKPFDKESTYDILRFREETAMSERYLHSQEKPIDYMD